MLGLPRNERLRRGRLVGGERWLLSTTAVEAPPKKSNLLSLVLINQSRRGQGAKRSTHMPRVRRRYRKAIQ